jgi:carbon-monoxide dehydrogenase large subunit
LINPLIVDGQIHGGAAQGVGQALCEAARYDESGQLLTASLMDYALPQAATMPEAFELIHLSTPSPLTIAGIKGMGEGGTVGVVAAIANAVADALAPFRPEINRLPLTPPRVRELVSGERGSKPGAGEVRKGGEAPLRVTNGGTHAVD